MARPQYGRRHQRARQTALSLVSWGMSECCRCGHPLEYGDRVDLDHRDDGAGYNGLAHSSPCRVCGEKCNQKAGGEKAALQAGKQLRERRCVICGTPFTAGAGRYSARTATCGAQACKTELRRIRAARQPDPEPPPPAGRTW